LSPPSVSSDPPPRSIGRPPCQNVPVVPNNNRNVENGNLEDHQPPPFPNGHYFGLDIDNVFIGLISAEEQLLNPQTIPFLKSSHVVYLPVDSKTNGDGKNGKFVSSHLFLLGNYGMYQLYMTEQYHGFDLRTALFNKVNKAKDFYTQCVEPPKNEKNHYHLFRAGVTLESTAYFRIIDKVLRNARNHRRRENVIQRSPSSAPPPPTRRIPLDPNDSNSGYGTILLEYDYSLEIEDGPYLYLSRYGQKFDFAHPKVCNGLAQSPLELFHALQVYDELTGQYKFPCSPDTVVDIAGTFFQPVDDQQNPRLAHGSLYIPVVKCFEKGFILHLNGKLIFFFLDFNNRNSESQNFGLPRTAKSALANREGSITFINHGMKMPIQHQSMIGNLDEDDFQLASRNINNNSNNNPGPTTFYGWCNGRIRLPFNVDDEDEKKGKLTRVVVYGGLKHILKSVTTCEMISMPTNVNQARRRKNNLNEFQKREQKLLEMKATDPNSKDVIHAQSIRIELRIVGYLPTKASDWWDATRDGPNLEGLGRYFSLEHLSNRLGIGLKVCHYDLKTALDEAKKVSETLVIRGSNRLRADAVTKLTRWSNLLGLCSERMASTVKSLQTISLSVSLNPIPGNMDENGLNRYEFILHHHKSGEGRRGLALLENNNNNNNNRTEEVDQLREVIQNDPQVVQEFQLNEENLVTFIIVFFKKKVIFF
jgi:hypothetical protein